MGVSGARGPMDMGSKIIDKKNNEDYLYLKRHSQLFSGTRDTDISLNQYQASHRELMSPQFTSGVKETSKALFA